MTNKNNYLKHVDGLRAFAVLSVLLFHLNVNWIGGGFVGVDVFFIISGFLITRLILKEIDDTNTFNFLNFYCRRVRRIFPALFVVLISTWIAGFFLFSPNHFQMLGGSIASAALSFSNIFFWNQTGYFNVASEFKPLLHTWSLGVEEQIYLITPLIYFFIATKFNKKILGLLLLIGALASLGLNIRYQNNHLDALYYLMPFRVFEFAIGSLTVWLIQYKYKKPFVLDIIGLIGLSLMVFAMLRFDKNTLFPSYNALIPAIGAALVIYSGESRIIRFFFSNKIAVALGLISYSLYLVHWPIIVFYSYTNVIPIRAIPMISKGLIIVVSIVLATGMYFFIETPFRKNIPKERSKQKILLSKWMPSTALTVVLGALIYYSNGWFWRIPEVQAQKFQHVKIAQNYHLTHFGGTNYPYPFGWTYQGQSKAPDIVLMGDSHAQMLQHGLFKEIAKPYNISIYMAGSSCIILPELYRTTPDYDWKSICPNVVKHGLNKLNKLDDSLVILSQAWSGQIIQTADFLTDKPLDTEDKEFTVLQTKLNKLRERIGNKTLVLIGDVPGAGLNDTFSCLTRPTFASSYCASKINTPISQNPMAIAINKALKAYAQKHKNTYFIDPYPFFCSDTTCRALSESGSPLYSDENHLSKMGSKYLIHRIKPQLIKIINKQKRLALSIKSATITG